MAKIAFIIPAYNEENNIVEVIKSLPVKDDIIVIDDGSSDNTYNKAKSMGVVVLRHNKNMGKGYAHRTGFTYAINNGYDYVITLDSDGQHDPNEIPKFTKKITESYDIIIGTRKYTIRNMPFLNYMTNKITSMVVSFLSHKLIKDSQSGYRAISTSVIKNVPLMTGNFQTESEILIKASILGYRIGVVPINTIYTRRKGKIHPLLDTIRFINMCFMCIFSR